MKRTATARWQGDLKQGSGSITTDSGVLSSSQYSFGTRFESGKGTNPEELLGAAHAGCFAMALSKILGEAGHAPEQIDAKATVNLEKVDAGFAITTIHLDVAAKVPGIDEQAFAKAADEAKQGCLVSKVLRAEIRMDAKLVT